jgi:hypothetical protein
MVLYMLDIVMVARRWVGSPCPRLYHALDGGRCTGRWMEDIQRCHTIVASLDAILYTLDTGHLDDDVVNTPRNSLWLWVKDAW